MSKLNQNKPLCTAFNIAVNHMASVLLPNGFDVADDAPNTFEDLINHFQTTKRILVWSGASDDTMFACPSTNHAFRAWHDYCHIQGNFAFTEKGEALCAEMQKSHIRKIYGNTEQSELFCQLIDCEINGQVAYKMKFDEFPTNQMEFSRGYLIGQQVKI